jgi:hypothetical protein
MVVALTLPVLALGLLHVLHQLEVWTLQQPLPHDPPPPPGYVDPLEGSDLLAELRLPDRPERGDAREVDDPDPA